MIELDKKYVLHIPLAKFTGDEVVEIDIDEILDELKANLNQKSFYITRVESHYKSRCFDELLITIFTSKDDAIEETFRKWFLDNNDVLEQEAFAYECDGSLFIESLD